MFFFLPDLKEKVEEISIEEYSSGSSSSGSSGSSESSSSSGEIKSSLSKKLIDEETVDLEPPLNKQIQKKSNNTKNVDSIDNVNELSPSSTDKDTLTVCENIKAVLDEFKNPSMQRLMPTLLLTGIMQGVPTSSLYRLTTMASEGMSDVEIDKRIAITMMIYAGCGIITGRVLQKILEKGKSRRFIIFLNTLFLVTTFFMMFIFYRPNYYYILIVSTTIPNYFQLLSISLFIC